MRSVHVSSILREFRPEVISHHAAQISVSLSAREPKLDAEVNVLGGLNLLEAAVAAGVRRVIFASTGGAMYGLASSFRVAETAYATPVSPYAVAKLAFERYLRAYESCIGSNGSPFATRTSMARGRIRMARRV